MQIDRQQLSAERSAAEADLGIKADARAARKGWR